jgi:hypothetical protein
MLGSECQTGPWGDFSREPVLPVPPFVTHEWLAPRVAANYGLLKEMHKGHEEIQRLSGFSGWPDRQPSFDEFIELLIDGFRYPSFVRAVTRVAARHISSPKKRERFHLFKPFASASGRAVKEAARAIGREAPELDGDEMRQLADAGDLDVAFGRMFFMTLGQGASTDYLTVARERPGQFGSLIPFLEAAEKYLRRGDFDWQRDVLGFHRVTPERDRENMAGRGSLRPVIPEQPPAPDELREANPVRLAKGSNSPPPTPPTRDVNVEPDGGDVSRTAWDSAIAEVVFVGNAAIGGDPDLGVLSRLVAALKAARSAQKAWEHSKPVLMDAMPLANEIRRLAATLAEFAEQDAPDMPQVPALVTAAAAEAATSAIAEARRWADEAAIARTEATTLMASGDLRNVEAVFALRGRLRAAAADGLGGVRRAAAALAEGAPVMAEHRRPRGPAAIVPKSTKGAELSTAAKAGDDDAALELVAELADAEADELHGPEIAGARTPDVPPESSESDDPFAVEVERKLAGLFRGHEFGLAYHLLRAARRVFPDRRFLFAEAELRLAAMSGHNSHAMMQGSELLGRLLREALDGAEGLRADADHISFPDAVIARGTVLYAVSCPLALFHPASPAVQVIQTLDGILPLLADGLRGVTEAVVEAAHSGLPVTMAALRSASQEAEADTGRYLDGCRAEVLAKIRLISDLRFPFQLGNKVRTVLASSDGVVGTLREAIERDGTVALEAARAFASRYSERSAIIAMLQAAEGQLNSRVKGIDGAARERLVANIIELSALCDEFVQARDASPAVRNPSHKARMLAIRDAVCSGADRAIRTLGPLAERAEPLTAAAAKFAAAAFHRLKAAAQGQRSQPVRYGPSPCRPWPAPVAAGTSFRAQLAPFTLPA